MKVCGECKKYHTIVEENSVEVTECSFKECEGGHPIFRSELPEEFTEVEPPESTGAVTDSAWNGEYLLLVTDKNPFLGYVFLKKRSR